MSTLFRNTSPGALTLEQARAHIKKRMAEDLARQGRGGDTEVAHVALGELVVPAALQSPALLAVLARAAAEHNIPLERLRVGSRQNSVNPETGVAEFGLEGAISQGWNRLKGVVGSAIANGTSYFPEEPENPAAVVLPPGNAAMTPPSDEALDYHPNGPSFLGAVANDPAGALSAGWNAARAWQETKDRYSGGPAEATMHNGEPDAWRHARWNQRMANSIGPERAKVFADWNERQYGSANPFGERKMDLVNNQVGRDLVGDTSKLTVDELIRSGRLRTRPY